MKRRWVRIVLWLLCGLVTLALLAAAALDQRLAVRRYSVEADEITAPVRVAVLTDLHACDYGPDGALLLEALAAQEPDVVLMVGDMFADGGLRAKSYRIFENVADLYPTYYVTGNHECWLRNLPQVLQRLAETGVVILEQECAVIDVRGQRISLCGIPDPYAESYMELPPTEVQLATTIAKAEPGTFTLLMAHRPELIDLYADAGFDLVVAGHAHGGQVRIPGIVNGLYAPDQGWFPRYAGGKYRVGETTLIVSRGLSTQRQRGIPRIFNRPELVIVTLE